LVIRQVTVDTTLGQSDEFHLKKANELNAVILTHDADFLKLATKGYKHKGIIYVHPQKVTISKCIREVELLTQVLTDAEMQNHIEFL
jgi:predicted nuclease of predicted toxin-antitoxin system